MENRSQHYGGLRWWGYCICLIIIIAGTILCADIVKTFTAKSTSIGFSTETKYFKKAVDIDFSMSQSSLQLNENTSYYEYTTTIKAVDNYDGTKNKYELLVNNNPCTVNDCGAGYLKSEYRLKYYNIEGSVDVDNTLYVNIQFFENKTQIQILTKADSNVVSFWKSYISNNGLNLNIIYAKL